MKPYGQRRPVAGVCKCEECAPRTHGKGGERLQARREIEKDTTEHLSATNDAIRIPAGIRCWDTAVAGGRLHTIVDGRAVVVPTRADLVGRVCQLSLYPIKDNSDGIRDTVVMYDAKRDEYHGDGGQSKPWKYARLYREDRP